VKLVDGDDFPIMGEHHHSKHRRVYYLHSVHVATAKQDVVIKRAIDNLNVDKDIFPLSSTRTFWKSPSGEDGHPS
jgi:hypothetical protein